MKIYIIIFLIYIYLFITINYNVCNIYVELSASSIKYFIYLPIVVKSWKEIGYNSIVFLTYYNHTKDIIYVENILKILGSEVISIKLNESVSLHYGSKLIRFFGFEISRKAKTNDYFILSDADIIPFSHRFFDDKNYNKLTIKSFNRNGYGKGNNKGRWAICYIIANKFIWKDVLKEDIISNNVELIITHILNRELSKGEKYFEDLNFLDEVYMRDRIRKWKLFETNVLFHPRNYYKSRIDRSNWPNNIFAINKSKIIDIHLPRLPNSMIDIKKFWIEKIMPLQLYLFNKIPFGITYIENLLYIRNNTL